MIDEADLSATALVVKLAEEFECFRDEHVFEGRRVNFYKRAQILVAGQAPLVPSQLAMQKADRN
jgi:hypothetical protein